MKYPVYCIKDLKGEFWSPRVEQNEASAKRNFAMMVNTADNLLNFAPSDFELYYIAEFDASTGEFICPKIPEFICRASEMVGAYNA